MRPLFHPPIEDVSPEAILHALADTERAAIFAHIGGAGSGGTCSASGHACGRIIPKSSLSAHIKVLREAGLIRCERHGIEMRNSSRVAELDERLRMLVDAVLGAYRWFYRDKVRKPE